LIAQQYRTWRSSICRRSANDNGSLASVMPEGFSS
jgi:hypothetical protein